jgi:hypothetical protein
VGAGDSQATPSPGAKPAATLRFFIFILKKKKCFMCVGEGGNFLKFLSVGSRFKHKL